MRPASRTALISLLSACLLLILTSCAQPATIATLPAAVAPMTPQSWIGDGVLLTVYGRAFGNAPILGRLGMDYNFNDMTRQVQPYIRAIRRADGNRPVRVAVHLIYALATPCDPDSTCLFYLDDAGVDIVKQYIKPAASRGWLVILDDQLGRSNPVGEAMHIIAKGYLRYDNVQVAFDPEFRMGPAGTIPGEPVGAVSARELNAAERLIGAEVERYHLPHYKFVLVHQWNPQMIEHRRTLRSFSGAHPVIVMDGIGSPADKLHMYNVIDGPRLPGAALRGIKVFPPNPYEMAGHLDTPLLNWSQLFGRATATDSNGERYRALRLPDVLVLT